jgi:hypothetical protein
MSDNTQVSHGSGVAGLLGVLDAGIEQLGEEVGQLGIGLDALDAELRRIGVLIDSLQRKVKSYVEGAHV